MFSYVIDWTLCNAVTGSPGVQLSPSVYITYLEFTDSVVMFNGSPAATQEILYQINISITDQDNVLRTIRTRHIACWTQLEAIVVTCNIIYRPVDYLVEWDWWKCATLSVSGKKGNSFWYHILLATLTWYLVHSLAPDSRFSRQNGWLSLPFLRRSCAFSDIKNPLLSVCCNSF